MKIADILPFFSLLFLFCPLEAMKKSEVEATKSVVVHQEFNSVKEIAYTFCGCKEQVNFFTLLCEPYGDVKQFEKALKKSEKKKCGVNVPIKISTAKECSDDEEYETKDVDLQSEEKPLDFLFKIIANRLTFYSNTNLAECLTKYEKDVIKTLLIKGAESEQFWKFLGTGLLQEAGKLRAYRSNLVIID